MGKIYQTLEIEFEYFSKYHDTRCFELISVCLYWQNVATYLIFYISAGLVQFRFETVQWLNNRDTVIRGRKRDQKDPYPPYTCLIIFLSL